MLRAVTLNFHKMPSSELSGVRAVKYESSYGSKSDILDLNYVTTL